MCPALRRKARFVQSDDPLCEDCWAFKVEKVTIRPAGRQRYELHRTHIKVSDEVKSLFCDTQPEIDEKSFRTT